MWRNAPKDENAVPVPISSTADPSRGQWFPFLFFGLFGLMGLVCTYFFLVQPAIRILLAREWAPTDCEVISSSVGRHSGSKGGSTYSVDMLYRYQFKGKEFQSSRYKFATASTSGSWPIWRTLCAIWWAMTASCSADGVSLIEVSARNTVPWRATTME